MLGNELADEFAVTTESYENRNSRDEAEEVKLERNVAIKVLAPVLA